MMKKTSLFALFHLFFFSCLLHSKSIYAVTAEALIQKSKIPSSNFGIWIDGPDLHYAFHADKKMIPASLSKIATAGAVLSELGLNHQFETKVWSTGTVQDEVLNGDLYLQGGGDPSVVSETFWVIINELKRTGIRKIIGQLYVDDSLFDQMHFSDSRQSFRVDRAYDAPVGALSFNWNSVNVFVRPGAKVGEPAKVFADPQSDYIELKNFSKTGHKTDLRVERKKKNKNNEKGDVIEVHGMIAESASEQAIYKSISAPDYWAGENFKSFLNQQGIEYKGEVQKKAVPLDAKVLVTYKSKPLKDIVSDMAKFSNNYVAEMITKSLSTQKPATLKSGVERIQQWLIKQGWNEDQFVFENPSGFSHENKFRAEDLGHLLQNIHKDFSFAPEFMSALPISGVDGTLKKRLKDQIVRAKTGYLDGIIGLAGYFTKNGKEYTFVFMYNGPTKYDAKVREVFDEIIRQTP